MVVENATFSANNNDNGFKFGQYLAHPSTGEEVVISGLSGAFPESNNVEEFQNNLFNKVDMVTEDERRWKHTHPEVPKRTGKIPVLDKFDCGFFGVHLRQSHSMPPKARIMLEKVFEAILDAGVNPDDLEGSNTGIFLGSSYSESELKWYFENLKPQTYAITGNEKSIFANRISYFLKVHGISINIDTACNSTMAALDDAYRAIRTGKCDNAILIGANLVLHRNSTLQFARLGVLSKEGRCKVFDEDGSGYARSEAVVAAFLQKSRDCNRIYARVVHAKSNCDGYKEQGITYPNGDVQKKLLEEVYAECGIDPLDLSYLEAHGTGTKAGDPEELKCVDAFFAQRRSTPLIIGSVKSNIGHSEPASGLCSITKAIIAFETGSIAPNLHFNTPRREIEGLRNGKLRVVTKKTPLGDRNGLIGISSFGFGGSNTHALLKWNPKEKINCAKPTDDFPRLVCVSGRTEESIHSLVDDVAEKFDYEHIRLIHNVFRKPIKNHLYRGYIIVSKQGELKRSLRWQPDIGRPLCVYFGVITNDMTHLVPDLFDIPCLVGARERIARYFSKKSINLESLFKNSTACDLNRVLVMFTTQVVLVELFKELELKPTLVMGKSFGEFAGAYFENLLTLEEFLECAYAIAEIVDSVDNVNNKKENPIFTKFEKEFGSNFKSVISKEFKSYKTLNGDTKTREKFPETMGKVPKTAIIVEFGQVLPLLKRKSLSVVSVDYSGGINGILDTIGRLYELGCTPQIHKLYPKVDLPVSRGTPMISTKIKWCHHYEHWTPDYAVIEEDSSKEVMSVKISPRIESWTFLEGHVIDGRNLFPASGYLYLAWCTLGQVYGVDPNEFKVVFENCKFKRACTVPKPADLEVLDLSVMLHKQSGRFEIIEGDVPVVTGIIKMDGDPVNLPLPRCEETGEVRLSSSDIYKELRLRGYNYRGLFRGLAESNKEATKGIIEWSHNWVAFVDNMLQMKILGEDTRLLYVPTGIAKLIIDPTFHREFVEKVGDGVEYPRLPVYVSKQSGVIRSGGVEIRGLLATSIARRKAAILPLLEKYQFIANESDLSLENSVRVLLQVALENICGLKMKVAELVDEATYDESKLLAPLIEGFLIDEPLVQCNVTVLSPNVENASVKVENKKLRHETDCTMVVGSNLLDRSLVLKEALDATVEFGYLISRESLTYDVGLVFAAGLTVLNVFTTDAEKLVFLRKTIPKSDHYRVVRVSIEDREFKWLPKLQSALKGNSEVIIYSQGEPLSGIMGLVNCLRREPDGERVRMVFIVDQAPEFNPVSEFYQQQLDKNMAVNIYMDGRWGTYRHMPLGDLKEVEREHCFANSTTRGDLSSIKWIEGPLRLEAQESVVRVYYSSLNFRDVMTASGKINVDVITKDRRAQECVQGFEFSGKTCSGRRVMGMVSQGALATLVQVDENLLWDIPRHWSLQEAATVPVVYATCLYALVMVGQIKPKETVLIHSGTGGIGQAAITICLGMGCQVFTTVGTEKKREFIKKQFPQINESQIGRSRDLSFERLVMKKTGRGVDVVLNSLSEEKLFASVRCLAKNGRFLEIGKFDLANDNHLNLLALNKSASYHGVMLDRLFNEPPEVKKQLKDILQEYINSNAVKPLVANIFDKDELEEAFRYMATGKHIGKVVIKVREENGEQGLVKLKGMPRYTCDPNGSYIICGGLGGFGLELADWLVLRGAKNLVLSSRKGVTTGYQSSRICTWRAYGCNIIISTEDITNKVGCDALIREAMSLGPVTGIFNLAVVLQDAILENQNEKSFHASFGPKAYATEYLDELSRRLCPDLNEFVAFSSISCGRGNAGQTNYAMANSVMNRICEQRRKDGLPGLSIEWGAVGDVGLVADMLEQQIEIETAGILHQTIASCLQVLDTLLRQEEAAVVSSMVVAEKKTVSSSQNILEAVAKTLGIRDINSVGRVSTLAELGMDSMNAVEIKQILERDFGIYLTSGEIRGLTFSKLEGMQQERDQKDSAIGDVNEEQIDINAILKYVADMAMSDTPVVQLETKNRNIGAPLVIALPGMEGVATQLQHLAALMDAQVYSLQYCNSSQEDTIPEMVAIILPHIKKLLSPSEPFHIVAHSLGAVVAVELVSELEELGYSGTLSCIDGSPDFLKVLIRTMTPEADDNVANILTTLENSLVAGCMRFQLNEQTIAKHMEAVCVSKTLEDKLDVMTGVMEFTEDFSPAYIKDCVRAAFKRLKGVLLYEPNFEKLKTKVVLYKAAVCAARCSSPDYGLSNYTKHPVEVRIVDGNHNSILENQSLAAAIMDTVLG